MGLLSRLKSTGKVLLHGETPVTLADIHYMQPSSLLEGKKIIITGGSRGLGFSMAKKFISEGAIVLITGRNEEKLRQAADELKCQYEVFDVNQFNEIPHFIHHCEGRLQGLDILVNNAGISLHEQSFFDVTPSTFRLQLATNLEGPFFMAQAFAKILIDGDRAGTILFVSSETSETVDFRPYGFTKGAINSMVKGLAYLFKKKKIRVNAVAPGVTASDMTGLSTDGNLSAGDYGTGRYYLPDEVAQIATFLISDITGNLSGQIITCNNAQTINARWK